MGLILMWLNDHLFFVASIGVAFIASGAARFKITPSTEFQGVLLPLTSFSYSKHWQFDTASSAGGNPRGSKLNRHMRFVRIVFGMLAVGQA